MLTGSNLSFGRFGTAIVSLGDITRDDFPGMLVHG